MEAITRNLLSADMYLKLGREASVSQNWILFEGVHLTCWSFWNSHWRYLLQIVFSQIRCSSDTWLQFAWWHEWVLSYLLKTMIASKAVVMVQYTSELQVWDTVYKPVWHWIMLSNGIIPFPPPAPPQSLDGWIEGFAEQFIGKLAFSEWWPIIAWWPSSDNRVAKEVINTCKDKDKIYKSY